MDDYSDTANSMGTGVGEQLHDGWVDSHPAGDCHCRCANQRYFRTQSLVVCKMLSLPEGDNIRSGKMKT